MTTVLGSPGSGAGQTDLQRAYDNSGGANPMIQLAVADGAFTIRDDAVPLANMFSLQNNAGTDFFDLDADSMDYGLAGNRGYEFTLDPTGREGISFLPDGRTQTTVAITGAAITWSSLVVAAIPGGGGIGNDTAPAMIQSIGECRFDEQGNLFATSLLFNQGSVLTANGVNLGPVYTMVNQPLVRTGTLGGSRTMSQANAVRSQIRVGPNLAGNITLVSHVPFLITATVDATVGTASITTMYGVQLNSPTLTAGGTIGTYVGYRFENVSGPTTIRGLQSIMNNGLFIQHTGTADSEFTASNIGFNDGFGIELGTGDDVLANWNGSALEFAFAAFSDDFRISNPANTRFLIEGNAGIGDGGDEFNFACARFSLGAQSGAVGNQVGVFAAGARSTQVAGEWSDFLLTQAANLTVDDAMGLVAGWTINAPSMTLGTGSVTTAGALNVGGNVNQGSVNRFGVRILSNPSGGSGVNAALWVTAGLSRFDGRVDINNGIALGGGAGATLGTIGGSGPTAAAQAQWVEIDIGGTPHWIPAWT